MMSNAQVGDTVAIHYTGRLDDGAIFATSRADSPVELTVGEGLLIPTLEETLVGMTPGEERTVTVPAARAYGEKRPELFVPVERSQFPPNASPSVGQQLRAREESGEERTVTVVEVKEDEVFVDAYHPLAGQDLTFEVTLVEIRAPRA
jgi:peptidylprolyl isomerase